LRIPLRAISGYARMLQEDYADKLDDEAQRLLKVIRDNSKRMGELIDDLLTFSRLGRKPIAAAEIDMKGVVDHIIEEVRRRTEHDRVEIQVDTLPPAWGDRSLLQQVWTNLISNAIKYSGKRDQPVIRIEGKNLGTETVYSISDNGVGFDMQYYNKLFGVFQRLHSADEFPGTGVGLAIVHRIVVRLGGRVWAVSTIDEGATFFFAFPQK
jgi:light-regulated signal transduction histidine kinase (bacteriophytochrome)